MPALRRLHPKTQYMDPPKLALNVFMPAPLLPLDEPQTPNQGDAFTEHVYSLLYYQRGYVHPNQNDAKTFDVSSLLAPHTKTQYTNLSKSSNCRLMSTPCLTLGDSQLSN
jgi:hypothetical protein